MNARLENGKKLLVALKHAAGSPGGYLAIPVGTPVRGLLRPLASNTQYLSAEDVADISDWRNRFVDSFLTNFHATPQRTTSWLTDIVGPNESKILFMLDLVDGTTVGHIGIDFIDWKTGYAEADAVVRGRNAPRGIMRDALLAVISWARGQLGIVSIGVRVRSDNPALEFYKKIGFAEVKRLPLRQFRESDMVRWVEDAAHETGNVFLVHMVFAENT